MTKRMTGDSEVERDRWKMKTEPESLTERNDDILHEPLQTLIWYPALPSGTKSMKVGDYVTLADTEISFGVPDQEHNKWRTRLKSSFDVPLWAVRDAKMAEGRYPVLATLDGSLR